MMFHRAVARVCHQIARNRYIGGIVVSMTYRCFVLSCHEGRHEHGLSLEIICTGETMRRTFSTILASAAFAMMTGTFEVSTAVAGQMHDTFRSEYFTARVLKVESDTPGSKWVTIEFVVAPLSQAEAVSIRRKDEDCVRPAFLMDAKGNKFISAYCVVGVPQPDTRPQWLLYPSDPVVWRYHFVGTEGESRPPYNVVVPVIFAKSSEGDRPPTTTAHILSFFGIE